MAIESVIESANKKMPIKNKSFIAAPYQVKLVSVLQNFLQTVHFILGVGQLALQ